MAVYLSPGVFTNEIDLSVLPSAVGPLRPAFIGTAVKGPVNVPVLLTNAAQAIEVFGPPDPQSYMMYAILHFMEEGNQCYGMRVAVEELPGLPDPLAEVAIDTSGGRGSGWGRIPLFTGIDFGRIDLRAVSSSAPLDFHPASVASIDYNDAELSGTEGATDATLTTAGTYTGAVDEVFTLLITGAPTNPSASAVAGATYDVVRGSDGVTVISGTLTDPLSNDTSGAISVGNGLTIKVRVTAGAVDVNDTFVFSVVADNRAFTVSVEGASPTSYQMPTDSYTSVADFVEAFNGLLSGQQYQMGTSDLLDGTTIPQLRTLVEGRRIQLTGSKAFAAEVGVQQCVWDVPRSYLLGLDSGPYNITSANNRVTVNVIGSTSTKTIIFNLPTGLNQTATAIAEAVNAAGVVNGQRYFEAFTITLPDGTDHVVLATPLPTGSYDHSLDMLQLLANYSNLKTLRFAEELAFQFPYQRPYRGFNDTRVVLPGAGETDATIPQSCEDDPGSDACAADTAYYANIVGWLVAPSPGTWLNGYSASLSVATGVVGDPAGRYNLSIKNPAGQVIDTVQDVNFDARLARYIGNVVNPGTTIGGVNGNQYVNWEPRPTYLNFDPTTTDYEVRLPSPFYSKPFAGMADGIPLDPAYSSDLDAAVLGNPAEASGLYAFQNPEALDINLLATPGFSSGAVIGTALQVCESRGDVLYLVDPPFGLRPQQVVDWHNGMLLSEMSSAIDSSYGALYWSWLKTYDQFSRTTVWVPPSGHVSAVFSRTARVEQWLPPAGLNRGRLLTAQDVEYSPTQGERDLLYGSGNAVNAIAKFPQDGIVVFGQRTLNRTDEVTNRVSTRMLLIYLKKNLTRTLRNFLFEPDDKFLWKQVQNTVEPFLADVGARRGIIGYKVVVDETNNTPTRVNNHELWVSVFIKPTPSAEFVVLNLVSLDAGASFSASEVLAAGGIVTS